jgi:hypothetical protein
MTFASKSLGFGNRFVMVPLSFPNDATAGWIRVESRMNPQGESALNVYRVATSRQPALFICDGAAVVTIGGLAFRPSTWNPAIRL